MAERWRSVVGFEWRYEVSDQGRVRSLVRDRALRPGRSLGGHLSVVLGRGNTRSVHALVMCAFVGPRPHGLEVRHLNGDPSDNRLDNLAYGTRSQNNRDKKHHAGQSNFVLTVPQVREIKNRLSVGRHGIGAELSREFGVAQSTISAIRHGRFHVDI